MNNLVFSTVTNVISFFKRLRLERVFIAALAGFLLLVNTACSQTSPPTADSSNDSILRSADSRGGAATTSPYKGQAKQQRELYDPVQPRKGGMNEYSDDFKQDSGSTKAKAEDLINRSKQNLQKRADSPEQFVKNYQSGTPLNERVGNITEDVKDSARELGNNFSKGVEKGSRNIKENTAKLREDAPRVVEQAGRNIQGTGNKS